MLHIMHKFVSIQTSQKFDKVIMDGFDGFPSTLYRLFSCLIETIPLNITSSDVFDFNSTYKVMLLNSQDLHPRRSLSYPFALLGRHVHTKHKYIVRFFYTNHARVKLHVLFQHYRNINHLTIANVL